MKSALRVSFTTLFAAVAGTVPPVSALPRQEGPAAAATPRAPDRPASRPASRPAAPASTTVAAVRQIVADVLRADYRGDLEGLTKGHAALAIHEHDAVVGGPVRYWLGFAQWRLALNRMNVPDYDKATALRELRAAVSAFLAVADDNLDADAKSAAAGCLMSILYLQGGQKDPDAQKTIDQFQALMRDAVAAAPDNPRVLWVRGGQQLWTPPEFGGSRAKALATFERGLAASRKPPAPGNPLAPAWGEPELLTSLAYVFANVAPFDFARAETYVRDALKLQPEWRYARENLLPAVLAKAGGK